MKKIETKEAPLPVGSYSQAVKSGQMVFVSGQIPMDPITGELITDIEKAAKRVLDSIEAVLRAAGCSFDDVVRVEIFLVDLKNFSVVDREYQKRFSSGIYPARQTVEVSRLPKDACIEISCIAVSKRID